MAISLGGIPHFQTYPDPSGHVHWPCYATSVGKNPEAPRFRSFNQISGPETHRNPSECPQSPGAVGRSTKVPSVLGTQNRAWSTAMHRSWWLFKNQTCNRLVGGDGWWWMVMDGDGWWWMVMDGDCSTCFSRVHKSGCSKIIQWHSMAHWIIAVDMQKNNVFHSQCNSVVYCGGHGINGHVRNLNWR